MLLPRQVNADEESDPRAELARRLQEYEQIKIAAENLDQISRLERDTFIAHSNIPDLKLTKPLPDVDLRELLLAFKEVLHRVNMQTNHFIQREPLSIRERMTIILSGLNNQEFQPFLSFFTIGEGRQGLVVTFIAMLELIRENLLEFAQTEPFAPIYLRKRELL
jgi:segregation and condensation protein A